MVRVAVYTRLSSDPTGEQTATQRQAHACAHYAEVREWTVSERFEDVDLSAYKAVERPGYEALLEAIRSERVDGVLVWKLDRLVRRPAEFERFWSHCERHDVFLASVTEPIDSSTELGLALVRILVTFAALESATSSLRMRARNEQAARRGDPPGRRAYGFRRGWSEHEPAEAAVIQEIAGRVLRGETLTSVAEDLNARGVPSPGGGRWRSTPIGSLLRNPRLVGDRVYRGEVVATDCFPPILALDDFARLAVILRRPGRQARGGLFSGILVCARCGGRMYPHTSGYACNKDNGCGRTVITASPLETHVLPRLFHHAERVGDRAAPTPPEDKTAWTAQLHDASRALSRAYVDLRARRITYPDYLARRRSIEHDLAIVTYDVASGAALRDAWPGLSLQQRQAVLMRDIERITIHPARRTGTPFDPTRIRIRWWTHPQRDTGVEASIRAALAGARTRIGRHASRWLTLNEAATELANISPRRVLRFVISGALPAYRDGNELWFRAHEVADFAAACRYIPTTSTTRTKPGPSMQSTSQV